MHRSKKTEGFSSFSSGDYTYELFRPKPWKLFLVNYQETSIRKTIRFILSSITGDYIFYMKDKKGSILGYCLLEKKNWRYEFIMETDFVISPYVVNPIYRGQGFGTRLLVDISENIKELEIGKLYAFVKQENIPSMKAMENAKARKIGFAEIEGIRRKYVRTENKDAEYIVYCF